MNTAPHTRDGQDYALYLVAAGVVVVGALWAAGAASAVIAGHPVPHGGPLASLAAFARPGDPSLAWGGPVGPPAVYWLLTTLVVAGLAGLVFVGWRLSNRQARRRDDPTRAEGLADRRHVADVAGRRALLARASMLRPSISRPRPTEVGYRLGSSGGVACWASVEDSMLLLGPPRSGKGPRVD